MNDENDERNYMENEPIKKLSLTRNEALYIDDSVTMLIEAEPDLPIPFRPLSNQALVPVPANLLDKLGKTILEFSTSFDAEEIEIELYVSELYMLREICLSYVKYGTEPVGYNLKKKVYKALLGKEVEDEQVLNDERQNLNNLLANVDMHPKPLE
jgi:hypothetical protein